MWNPDWFEVFLWFLFCFCDCFSVLIKMTLDLILNVYLLIFGSLFLSVASEQLSFEDVYSKYPSPKLHPLQDQHVVSSGEKWTLRCSGKFPLEWVFPSTDNGEGDVNMTNRVTVTNEVIPGDNPRPHVSYLEVNDLRFLDTGRYHCRYVGTSANNVFDNVTSTYLFASDPNELIDMDTKMVFVNVPQHQVNITFYFWKSKEKIILHIIVKIRYRKILLKTEEIIWHLQCIWTKSCYLVAMLRNETCDACCNLMFILDCNLLKSSSKAFNESNVLSGCLWWMSNKSNNSKNLIKINLIHIFDKVTFFINANNF